jgi:hypothetical protein
MAAHPPLQFRTIALYPPPYSRIISLQTTFLKQFFAIAQGKRVGKIPADRTENQSRLGRPALEDRQPGCHWVLFKLAAAPTEVVNTTRRTVLLLPDCLRTTSSSSSVEQTAVWLGLNIRANTAKISSNSQLSYASMPIAGELAFNVSTRNILLLCC